MNWRTLPSAVSFAATSLLLTLAGCSVSAHSEWHTGSGNAAPSAGSEEPEQHEAHHHHHHHEGQDHEHVVRVTPEKSADGSGDQSSPRGEVHPTGPAPEGSAGSDGSASAGNASSDSGGGDTAAAVAPDNSASDSTSTSSSDQASEGGKGTLKHESDAHVARPVRRRPSNKGETKGDSESEGTNKNGRRE